MLSLLLTHSPLLYFMQSVWRDEAYSVLFAQKPLSFIFSHLTFETPLYYVLLHFWMQLFGNSEIAARTLSLIGFGIAVGVVIEWADVLYKKHWLAWFLPLFFALNPMLLYYAFEIRTYGWVVAFATLTMYAYQQRKWKLFIVAATLGFYTHSYFLLVPFTAFLHSLYIRKPILKNASIILFLSSPWLIKIAFTATRLTQNWYYPIDVQTLLSVLGNLFIGYDGTPAFLWYVMPFVSLGILCVTALILKSKQNRERNTFFIFMMAIPLIITIGISLVKPLFVNRYVLFVTIAQVFLLAAWIQGMKNKTLQKITAFALLFFVLAINTWYPPQHRKVDIRSTLESVNAKVQPNDVVYADDTLVFFETMYYSKYPNQVYWYNPRNKTFPWYVGDALFDPSKSTDRVPKYPYRAFVVRPDGTFYVTYEL